MARIAGVDLPKHKRGVIALTYIFGVGNSRAKEILSTAKVSEDTKVSDWNDDEISAIRDAVSSYTIEGELRSETQLNIKRLMDIGCYRGIRHRNGLPKVFRWVLSFQKNWVEDCLEVRALSCRNWKAMECHLFMPGEHWPRKLWSGVRYCAWTLVVWSDLPKGWITTYNLSAALRMLYLGAKDFFLLR